MSRRRKGNPLLGRIFTISVVVHAIAIPILARFGAFEKIRRELTTSVVTVVPPPPAEKEKPIAKKEERKATPKAAKGKSSAAKASSAAKSNLPQPKVVSANSGGSTDSGGPTVDPNAGGGTAGVVPKEPVKPSTNGGANENGGGTTDVTKPTAPTTKPIVPPPVEPVKPEVKPTTTPHVPVMVSAEPVQQVQPEIPDDLLTEPLDKTVVVYAAVNADGAVVDTKVESSSGVSELDTLALTTAKKWRFHPAMRDGEPVTGHVRIHIRFKVE